MFNATAAGWAKSIYYWLETFNVYYIKYYPWVLTVFWWNEMRKMWVFTCICAFWCSHVSSFRERWQTCHLFVIHLCFYQLRNLWNGFFYSFKAEVAETSRRVKGEMEFNTSRNCIRLVGLNKRTCLWGETMRCTGPSLHIVHRLVGRAGWILPTPASDEAAVDLDYQIIGCVAFWESFSISFSGWLALFTPLCQHLVCPHLCGMSVNERYEATERTHFASVFKCMILP